MKKIIIVTGANKGLGKAFIDLALKDESSVIVSVSRELHEDHKTVSDDKIVLVKTDLSEPFTDSFVSVIEGLVTEQSVFYVFNNAGVILPINKIGEFSSVEIERSIAVNINYPVNLVNSLLKKFSGYTMNIVNISSGAGNHPISHWSLYGASKAYMAMFFKILKEENNEKLRVFNIDPGVLDTGMQESIRENTFPKQNDFIGFKNNDILKAPSEAARSIFEEINF